MVHGACSGSSRVLVLYCHQQSSPAAVLRLLPLECTSTQLLLVGNGTALKRMESIITLKCWKLASKKFTEKFRGVVCLAKVEVGWCREHVGLSPGVLNTWMALTFSGYVYRVPAAIVILQKNGGIAVIFVIRLIAAL
ncbi:hypothetical protein P7K49_031344 [Saguinus oedipus]|uniref:Uncharacterized protein n=1 Tax=Saguinus oedipus TaxID=9490 RepID=A0ABQ9TZ55_SAGOE|nr:hypothetical protein P7K49_031344 [Saguinus oedipus]